MPSCTSIANSGDGEKRPNETACDWRCLLKFKGGARDEAPCLLEPAHARDLRSRALPSLVPSRWERSRNVRVHAEPSRPRAARRRARAEARRSLPHVDDASAVPAEVVVEVRQVRADRGEGLAGGAGGHGAGRIAPCASLRRRASPDGRAEELHRESLNTAAAPVEVVVHPHADDGVAADLGRLAFGDLDRDRTLFSEHPSCQGHAPNRRAL
jgi:hypothetical protein